MRLSVLLLALFALCTVVVQAQGPVVLMGIDAEDFGHPAPVNYVTVMGTVYTNASNGGSGTLVIGGGKNLADDVTTFWNALSGTIGPITYVNGATNISNVSFAGYRMIGVVSDQFNTFGGGLTNAENEALTARAAAIAAFVNGGGGLLGFSSVQLTSPYGYLGAIGAFTFGSVGDDDITPTAQGLSVGVTDNLDGCCWHDSYLTFPSFLNVLAVYPQTLGQPAAVIGGQQVIIASNCPYSQGFWRNHGENDCHSGNNTDFWPALAFPMAFGSGSLSKADACEIIRLSSAGGNALRTLARQLIAAKLNIANGSPAPTAVTDAISSANTLIGALDPRTASVQANSPAGQQMTTLAGVLDLFNNNLIEPVCTPPAPTPKSGYTRPQELMAQHIRIDGNHPNPVSGHTAIGYTLDEEGSITLAVYNTLGMKVRELVSGSMEAGSFNAQWDGRDERGLDVANGVYFIKLTMGDVATARSITVAR